MVSTISALQRRYSRWRRASPAVEYAIAVACGQSIVWLLDEITVALLLTALGLQIYVQRSAKFAALSTGVVLGVVTAWVAIEPMHPLPSTLDVILKGKVHAAPRHSVPGEVVFLLQTQIGGKRRLLRCRAVDLPWRNSAHLEEGDEVYVRGDLRPVERVRNPFAWHSTLWRQGVVGEVRARFVSQSTVRATSLLSRLRGSIKERLTRAVGESGASGLLLSMALGYRDLISVQVEQAFKKLGLTHLLVVSGYQVSLVFGFITLVIHQLTTRLGLIGRYSRNIAHLLAFAAACLYVVCIGAEISAMRALLAAACVTAQLCSERQTSFAQRWGVALLGLQIMWPWCVFEVGVILTFAALFGIGLGVKLGWPHAVRTFILINIAVWVSTTLVIVIWRGGISPLGLVLNLLVAAPWSIANCTVGLVGLVGLFLQIPGCTTLLAAIAWCNEKLATAVLILAESRLSAWNAEGLPRVVLALTLTTVLILAGRKVSKISDHYPLGT